MARDWVSYLHVRALYAHRVERPTPDARPLGDSRSPTASRASASVRKGRVPDHSAVSELHGPPEVDLYADSTACTLSTPGIVNQHSVIKITHLHDGRFPVGKRFRDRLILVPWAIVESLGCRQLTVIWRLRGLWRYLRGRSDWC